MLASLVLMAVAATPVEHTRVTLLDDRPLQLRLVDDDEDHLDRDQESSSTRAARLENDRPSYFGPIALAVGGLALAGVGALTLFFVDAPLIYALIPGVGGFLMIVAAVIWGVHRISERAEYDERIKGLTGTPTAAADRRPPEMCRPLWSECG